MTTVINVRDGNADVYIGRGSKWGNPFKMESEADRDDVCIKYEAYFWSKGLFRDISELVDKTLGCYCKPKRCHGDFLAEVANFYQKHGYINKSDFEASRNETSQLISDDCTYVLIAGSRTFTNYLLFMDELSSHIDTKAKLCIVSGGAKGTDSLAERYAKEHKIPIKIFPADWNNFGKSAGYKRNRQMHEFLAQHSKRKCICFWDGQSKGTAHNFELAKEFHTELEVIRFDNKKSNNSTPSEPKFVMVNGKYVLKASK